MKNLIYLISAALLLSIAASSCEDDKKSAELLKQSTEIAMQRTDSFNQVRKDSLAVSPALSPLRGNPCASAAPSMTGYA